MGTDYVTGSAAAATGVCGWIAGKTDSHRDSFLLYVQLHVPTMAVTVLVSRVSPKSNVPYGIFHPPSTGKRAPKFCRIQPPASQHGYGGCRFLPLGKSLEYFTASFKQSELVMNKRRDVPRLSLGTKEDRAATRRDVNDGHGRPC